MKLKKKRMIVNETQAYRRCFEKEVQSLILRSHPILKGCCGFMALFPKFITLLLVLDETSERKTFIKVTWISNAMILS